MTSEIQTPQQSDILNEALESRLAQVRTSIPGKVISYDQKKQKAEIQPLLKRKYRNQESSVSMATVKNVTVMFPRTEKSFVKLPVSAGDTGVLLVMDRSIDTWDALGGEQDPKSTRKHNVSDSIFIPGLFYSGDKFTPKGEEGDLEIVNDKASAILKPTGEIKIDAAAMATLNMLVDGSVLFETISGQFGINPAGQFIMNGVDDVFQIWIDFVTEVTLIKTPTFSGLLPPVNVAQLVSFIAKFVAIKG